MKAVFAVEILLFMAALGALAVFASSITGDASLLDDIQSFLAGR